MIDQARTKRIIGLALPIMGGMLSQNILNIVDTAMVSRLDNSDAALAAVGLGSFAVFMCQALVLGLATGVQAAASRRKGEGRVDETALFLNTALLVLVIVGPLMSFLLVELAPMIYSWLIDDQAVIELGVPYFEVRLLGIMFVGMNFAFRGYWNAVDLAHLYMRTLIIMHVANIFLNYVFIFGNFGAPALGVTGAGIASVASVIIGTAVYFSLGLKHASSHGFLHRRPHFSEVKTLVKLALPNGIQQFFFSGGFLATYWIIGKVGTAELAAANVLLNLTMLAILPGLGFGLTSATLVGQALGRRQPNDARQWGLDVTKIAIVVMTTICLPMVVIPELVISTFYTLEQSTLELALWPMRIAGLSIAFDAVGMVIMQSLLGAGDTRRVMMVSICNQWLLFLPIAYIAGPVLGYGLVTIWTIQSLYRGFQAFVFLQFWRGERWAKIHI
ncbi:MAG: MATE family efflux transporter [Gammaproteobacteria bacterium]